MAEVLLHPGSKKLSELDKDYDLVAVRMPVEERIEYCEKVIDHAQSKLAHNITLLSAEQKEHLMEMITAARTELEQLSIAPAG